MSEIPLVRANNYEPVLATLNTIGAPIDRLTSTIKYPAYILETEPNSFVAEYPLWLLIENASRSQDIENFDYVIATNSSLNDLGDFCRSGTPSISVGRWQVEQYVTVLLIQLVRLVAGPNWYPRKMALT